MKRCRISVRRAGIGLSLAILALGLTVFTARAAGEGNPLLDPAGGTTNLKAPEVFTARFETTKGEVLIEVHREWSPRGADRFYSLVKSGFYNECRFFRVIEGFMAQIGINGDPAVTSAWMKANILDDPVKRTNTRGFVTFAKTAAPNSRTTQVFFNYQDNSASLDRQGFAPFGKVVKGMETIDALHSGYGEGAPRGKGPEQRLLMEQGNAYLEKDFPQLDYVKSCSILSDGPYEAGK